jgi:hypothetical protein
VEHVLAQIRAQLDLDADTERELLVELRGHLEEAVAEGRARGLDEVQALAQAAARFGVRDVGEALQATHVGWGAADGVIAAALPVACTLFLRWVVFPPGTDPADWWRLFERPAFWVVAIAALFLPLAKFRRWRYALASWAFFWTLSMISLIGTGMAR